MTFYFPYAYGCNAMLLNPPKTFSQNLLVVSLKVRNFVARYKCSAKVHRFYGLNKYKSIKLMDFNNF